MRLCQADLVALQRSTAMLAPGSPAAIKREELLELLDELTNTRALLARLGADLKTVPGFGFTGDRLVCVGVVREEPAGPM